MKQVAKNIIEKMGGVKNVSHVLSRDKSTVYLWTYSRERGGTGGLIPVQYHHPILDWAQKHGVDIKAKDFFDMENQPNA